MYYGEGLFHANAGWSLEYFFKRDFIIEKH